MGSFATISASPSRGYASCSSPRYWTTSMMASKCAVRFPLLSRRVSGRKPTSLSASPIPLPSAPAGSRFIAGEPLNLATKVFAGLV
jgi:hypothetical protein